MMQVVQEPYDSILRVCYKLQSDAALNRALIYHVDAANEIWEIVKEYGAVSSNEPREDLSNE